MDVPSAPRLSFLADIVVSVGPPIEVGPTIDGHRRIIPISGGRVDGPELKGIVQPGGADFQTLRTDTLTELHAQYAIETDDGERISVENFGIRTGSAEDIAALVRGEQVDAERIYFRCTPRMLSGGNRWAWLASRILVGTGVRLPGEVRLSVFVVD